MTPSHELKQRINPLPSPPAGPILGPGWEGRMLPALAALVLLALVGGVAWWIHGVPGRGAEASISLLIGASLGIVLQRGRFCFFCIFRDLIEERDSRGFYSVLSALAVGSICYAVVFGVFLPDPSAGWFPPDAHIGPVSWVLVLAGLAFGLGMALSGACVSGHLYRLGEGYTRAPIALLGTLIGFGFGFMTWRPFYLSTISSAPLPWLPQYLGYSGALVLQLILLGLLALILLRFLPTRSKDLEQTESGEGRVTISAVWQKVFEQRWSPGVTGAIVGVVGALAYLRVAPLGVTSQIGSVARTILTDRGLLADRLNGLDGFSGCITLVIHTISNNGLLISALVAASFAMALVSKRFSLTRLTLRNGSTALLGGILMGWGSMLALGCTIGTLLSGIMAFSVSGWVFFAAVFSGVWLGIKLRLHRA